ncbi:MAG TPA: ABC transporter permease [Thermodesulfobacteriota bacterium]
MRRFVPGRRALLLLPVAFVVVFLIAPLALTVAVSLWQRAGFWVKPALSLAAYEQFVSGARLAVLGRSLQAAAVATAIGLSIAYPIAYALARHLSAAATRTVLLLFTIPFLVNYIIRTFAWTWLLGRTGPVNSLVVGTGLADQPLDWLLFSDFAVYVGLVTSYMPLMVFPLWISLSGIEQRLVEASWLLGAGPWRTFWRVTVPLSIPGVFAAVVFGFVGSFGESAVPIILGGVGYQLMGNAITSALDVLNYPIAAAMSTAVVAVMLLFLACWYLAFDLRTFLGKILRWRF